MNSVLNTLSRVRGGTWIACLMNKDPRTVRLVVANQGHPLLTRYIEDMNAAGVGFERRMATRVIESGEPLVIESLSAQSFLDMLDADVRSYLAAKAPPLGRPVTAIACVLVPMRSRGATIGAMGVFDSDPGATYGRAEVDWIQAIADRSAVAVENAQLYTDAGLRLTRLTALRNIGLAISGSSDLRLMLQVILDQVLYGLGVDAADVMLLPEDGGEPYLTVAAQVGFHSSSIPDYKLPLDDRLPGRLLARPHVEPVIDSSAFSEFRRRTLFAREGFRAYCAAPLTARGQGIGALEVMHRSALHPDDEWLAFLEALAAHAAVAIDVARMQRQLASRASERGAAAEHAPRLSPLERQILGLLVEGNTNAAIADAVHLSHSTVKFHVRQILQKVGAGNRTELARVATRAGWL
jgi:GAF domain-containing protein